MSNCSDSLVIIMSKYFTRTQSYLPPSFKIYFKLLNFHVCTKHILNVANAAPTSPCLRIVGQEIEKYEWRCGGLQRYDLRTEFHENRSILSV